MAEKTRSTDLSTLKSGVNQASNNIYSLQINGKSNNALIVFGNDHYVTTYPTDSTPGEIISLFKDGNNNMDIYFVKNTRKYDYCQFPSNGGAGTDEGGTSFTGMGGLTDELNAIIGNYTKVNFFGMGVSGNFGALEQSMEVDLGKLNKVILTMNCDNIPDHSYVTVDDKILTLSDTTLRSSDQNAPSYIFKGESDFGTTNNPEDETAAAIIANSRMGDGTLSTIEGYSNVNVQGSLQIHLPTLLTSFS